MRIDDEVVDRPAEEGARVVALALLSDASAAADRMARGADDEALHDFRVGLRRLRTVLRAYRPWLEASVSRKTERKIKRQSRATNTLRDAEVQLAWLRSRRESLPGRRQQVGIDFAIERFEAVQRGAKDPARLVVRYGRQARRLSRRLGSYERQVETAGGPSTSFGAVLATLVSDQLDAVREQLDAVAGPLDELTIHQARIQGKRLRYLIEPLRGNRHADAREAVQRLKRLQDVLGELHDSHVLAHELAEALVEVAAERARQLHAVAYEGSAAGPGLRDVLRGNPRPGLLALTRLVRERRDALFADLQREWHAGGFEALAAEVRAVTAALEARAGGRLERRRKYLLAALPPRVQEAPAVEIVQGWLPGARVRERIRRSRGADGDRFWRSLKQGIGRSQLEAEEETTREVFETLWPLTSGHRVAKRRRRIEEGRLVWHVDEFTDRNLCLAEVELPAGTSEGALPDWLHPLVVRDVTDDPAYQNENLASAVPAGERSTSAASPEDASASSVHP